jgi:hypothetical protein
MNGTCGVLGLTAGGHRLWAHRSYKATCQMRIILGIFQTIAYQVRFSTKYRQLLNNSYAYGKPTALNEVEIGS